MLDLVNGSEWTVKEEKNRTSISPVERWVARRIEHHRTPYLSKCPLCRHFWREKNTTFSGSGPAGLLLSRACDRARKNEDSHLSVGALITALSLESVEKVLTGHCDGFLGSVWIWSVHWTATASGAEGQTDRQRGRQDAASPRETGLDVMLFESGSS